MDVHKCSIYLHGIQIILSVYIYIYIYIYIFIVCVTVMSARYVAEFRDGELGLVCRLSKN